MPATLDFIFEELPLLVDGRRRGMLVNGKAEIQFDEDSWEIYRIWMDAYEGNDFVTVPADPMEVTEESPLWPFLYAALNRAPWYGAITADVCGATEDGALGHDDADRTDRPFLPLIPTGAVQHPSASF